MTILNDTFYDNGQTGIEAGGVHSITYITNTIVYSHENGLKLNDPASTLSGDYNLLNNNDYAGGVAPGPHDITGQDPLFVDVTAGDFHISVNSPAIDRGNDADAPDVDFENEARPFDGNFDGTAHVDIGADELTGAALYLPLVLANR